jgi:hypothetical protein
MGSVLRELVSLEKREEAVHSEQRFEIASGVLLAIISGMG